MKKTLAILAIAVLAMSASAAGPLGVETLSGTNTLTWTYTGTSGCYVERVDVRCAGVNTAAVTVVNDTLGVTNALATAQATNGIVQYIVAEPVYRLIKGDRVVVGFTRTDTNEINRVAIYPYMK